MPDMPFEVQRYSLPRATIGETISFAVGVVLPVLAKGVIIRWPRMVGLVERLGLDSRAVKQVQQLRDKYGTGPLVMRVPIRTQALVLNDDHVHQILEGTNDMFATASMEKVAALSHFQPKGSLISHGADRTDRRRFNETVLDANRTMHRLAEHFTGVVEEEATALLDRVDGSGTLTWEPYFDTWMRIVRRVVLGDGAADDRTLTDLIARLRSDANWAFLRPKRTKLRDEFYDQLNAHLGRAEPGSLAAVMAATATSHGTHPDQQVPQWLFAFDPAGMATYRGLALLASHPAVFRRARVEIAEALEQESRDYPLLRSTILEALRLWPTTPMVLRESTSLTMWESGLMPENSNILIFAPFFHRDDANLEYAHSFAPDIWLEQRTNQDWPLVPFSGGPGICPGRNLVLLLGSTFLATILTRHDVRLSTHKHLGPDRPLPGTLNNYGVRFTLDARRK